jgi:diadenosine tetraphosphate (Ap4A) HIT family hydrolase
MYKLHSQLNADTIKLGQFDLSDVLLMNNANLPWVILVPRRDNIAEWHSLDKTDQLQLHHESMLVSELLIKEFKGDKLNTGALGNLVPQLHLHHIVRYQNDPAWPQPAWGKLTPKPYTNTQAKTMAKRINKHLSAQKQLKFISM